MRPSEVLDAHVDLMTRLGSPMFDRIVNALGEFEFGRSGGRLEKEGTTPVAEILKSALPVAHTFRVTHDMSMVVEHAAAGLDDLDRFDSRLAPTGVGFVAFDRPLPVVDMRGKTMLIHYLIWGPVSSNMGPSTLVVCFNDQWRQPDQVALAMIEGQDGFTPEIAERYREQAGRWATVGMSAFFNDQRLGPQVSMPNERAQAQLIAEGDTPHPGTNIIRYVHALWLLMEQTVAKVEDEKVERPSQRRAKKMRLPGKVTVIRLRREQGAKREPGESNVEWAHRWLVRGHWRWQAVSAHHPLAQEVEPGKYRARIWINPFVKGPEDAPLKQTEKVYSLER